MDTVLSGIFLERDINVFTPNKLVKYGIQASGVIINPKGSMECPLGS